MNAVTILGGNVAGLFTAIEIRKKHPHLPVTVYEKHKCWNKPCGGALSKPLVAELNKMGVFLEEAHQPEQLAVGTLSEVLQNTTADILIGNRYDLQEKLSSYVENDLNIPIIEKHVTLKDSQLFSKHTIVAMGTSGLSHHLLNRRWKKRDVAMVLRFDGEIESQKYPDHIIVAMDDRRMGFGWLFSGDGNHVNIGYGTTMDQPHELIWRQYAEFIDVLNTLHGCSLDFLKDGIKRDSTGWLLPMPVKKTYKVYNDFPFKDRDGFENVRFIGVGDALGMAHPVLGGGIDPAWLSAKLLARNMAADGTVDVAQYQKDIKVIGRKQILPHLHYHFSLLYRSRVFQALPGKSWLMHLLGRTYAKQMADVLLAKPCFDLQ